MTRAELEELMNKSPVALTSDDYRRLCFLSEHPEFFRDVSDALDVAKDDIYVKVITPDGRVIRRVFIG